MICMRGLVRWVVGVMGCALLSGLVMATYRTVGGWPDLVGWLVLGPLYLALWGLLVVIIRHIDAVLDIL
jgi:hypothetical protein